MKPSEGGSGRSFSEDGSRQRKGGTNHVAKRKVGNASDLELLQKTFDRMK
jgi:hypothetical protein